MKIHKAPVDVAGSGKWERTTRRYFPFQGGSRSRLPVFGGDPNIRRYPGFVGVDERLSEEMSSLKALYKHLGGAPKVEKGTGSLTALIQQVVADQQKAEDDAAAAAAKVALVHGSHG